MKKPNLFLVGCPRSGTTSFYEYFKEHPQVFVPVIKGPNFFGEEENALNPEYHKNEEKYLSLFSSAKNEKYLLDASHYFASKIAPKEIKKFNSESKILILLRNPFDVILSFYYAGLIPNNLPLEKVLKMKNNPQVKNLFENLKYYENIERYIKYFGKENVYVMIFEEFVKNPRKEWKKLCRFLGIRDDVFPDFKKNNPSREIKNKWILKFTRSKKLYKIRLLFKKILPESVLRAYRNFIQKITTKKEINVKREKEKQKLDFLKESLMKEIIKTNKLLHEYGLLSKEKNLINIWLK